MENNEQTAEKVVWCEVKPKMIIKNQYWEVEIMKDPVYDYTKKGYINEYVTEVKVLKTNIDVLKVGQIVNFGAMAATQFDLVNTGGHSGN